MRGMTTTVARTKKPARFGGDEEPSGPTPRPIKNCESLPALLLRYFKVLRHFGESFLAVKHARGKIGIAARPNAGFAASA
jgi:hypothetical protein